MEIEESEFNMEINNIISDNLDVPLVTLKLNTKTGILEEVDPDLEVKVPKHLSHLDRDNFTTFEPVPWSKYKIPEPNLIEHHTAVGGTEYPEAITLANLTFGGCETYCSEYEKIDMLALLSKFPPLREYVTQNSEGNFITRPDYIYISDDCFLQILGANQLKPEQVVTAIEDGYGEHNRRWYVSNFTLFGRVGTLKAARKLLADIITYPMPKEPDNSYRIGLLMSSPMGGIKVERFSITNRYTVDIDAHYNDNMVSFDKHIKNSLVTANGGLILLHGDPGTGKTSYIKYLSSKLREKSFIFVPSQYVDALSDPQFIAVMLNNPDSVLVVEDAEKCLKPRTGSGDSPATANILNITDGILGDIIKCHVICTINCGINEIDPALLRSGRNVGVYKFEKLSGDKVEKLGKGTTAMALCDVFNNPVEFNNIGKKQIGF